MYDNWHITSGIARDFPKDGQEIYCCIADDNSVSAVKKLKVDLKAFEDLLNLNPTWKILWQQVPTSPVPTPPPLSAISFARKESPYG